MRRKENAKHTYIEFSSRNEMGLFFELRIKPIIYISTLKMAFFHMFTYGLLSLTSSKLLIDELFFKKKKSNKIPIGCITYTGGGMYAFDGKMSAYHKVNCHNRHRDKYTWALLHADQEGKNTYFRFYQSQRWFDCHHDSSRLPFFICTFVVFVFVLRSNFVVVILAKRFLCTIPFWLIDFGSYTI